MIDVDHASIRFPTRTGHVDAVRDASFAVRDGEVFGLVGESGSGKSTLLRALTGLVPLASGSLSIDGRPVGGTPDRAFRRHVQMVFQDPYASLHRASPSTRRCASRCRSTRSATPMRGSPARCPQSASARRSASAIRTSCPAASGSASRSPAR
ncbi:dipeptide transport ATP-binding protein DppF [Burkholderia cenocepacia]|nr:dipeptide transport ATP-binding protein DppF [Burkholderia cenocepacia]